MCYISFIYLFQFAVVCKAILKECPAMISKLKDQDAELSTLCESSWEEVELSNGIPRPKDEVNKISDIIVQNRARMQHTKLESAKLIDKVEDYKKKIKAAFLW